MSYKINPTTRPNQAQRIFERYCESLRKGKVNRPEGLPEEIEITPETFQMCYKELPKDNIFRKCRMQLPKQWFINDTGIVITFKDDYPRVLKDNSSKEQRRSPNEKQLKVNSATKFKFKRKKHDANGHIQRNKKGKAIENPKTIMNYVLASIIFASEGRTIYLLDKELENNVKQYGLEAFGRGNSGNEPDEIRVRGVRGLKINNKEVIKPDDMLEAHHTEQGYIIAPDMLEIMPHWLHEKCAEYTASVSAIEEFVNLIKNTKECSDYLAKACPNSYIIIDNSKRIDKDGNVVDSDGNKINFYIHYKGINPVHGKGRVKAGNYKYFKIVPLTNSEHTALLKTNNMQLYKIIGALVEKGFNTPISLTLDKDKYDMQFIDGNIDDYLEFLTDVFVNGKASNLKAKIDNFLNSTGLQSCTLSIGAMQLLINKKENEQ